MYSTHRGIQIIAVSDNSRTNLLAIDDVMVCAMQLASDNLWWIVPIFTTDDDVIDDIGPFDSEEQANMFIILQHNSSAFANLES